jgi:acetyl esterase
VAEAHGPPIYQLSPAEAREVLRDLQASVDVELFPAEIEDRVVLGGPTGEVNIRIVKPANATGTLPLILHSHGGGWILGDKDTHEQLDRELANLAEAIVVFVDYHPRRKRTTRCRTSRRTPRSSGRSPTPARSGATRPGVALLGDSVGGNMTVALTLMAKERGGPKLAAHVLFYPVTDADLDTDSYRR